MKAQKTTEIRKLADTGTLLTEDDITLLEQREALKADLKRLDDELKPKIAATIDAYGAGRLIVGSRQVELKRQQRDSLSWASLATSLIDEATIEQHKPKFTVTHDIDSAKVVA